MFDRVFIDTVNGKEVIYLYLDSRFEISEDFYSLNNNKNLVGDVEKYLKLKNIDYRSKNIYLVIGNVIVGRINKKSMPMAWKYKEFVKFGEKAHSEYLSGNKAASSKLIAIKKSNGIIEKLKLNEFLFGTIAREMPDIFNNECLKAQSVISRTYAIKHCNNGELLDELNQFQLFWDRSYLKKLWGDNFEFYKGKILDAIRDTDGEIIVYENEPIECYTHYNDSGYTENSINILKLSYPYLTSVDSYDSAKLLRYRRIDNHSLSKLLGISVNKDTEVKILEKTSGNNVRYVQFGDLVFDGLILGKKLGLISNNYTVYIDNDFTTFYTKGCGHGLGLSKCGAKNMADMGYNYRQIIEHFYPSSAIRKIN